MNEDLAVVFHGFLELDTRSKMGLIEKINEYFDAIHREPVREAGNVEFAMADPAVTGNKCKCCGR